MNVYDFDKTIFFPDSSACFLLHCLKKYPRVLMSNSLSILMSYIRYKRDSGTLPELKEALFSFLPYIDAEREADLFWRKHYADIQPWYLKNKRADDVIVSASPEFLIRPIARMLGVSYIATSMSPSSGKIQGLNNSGSEKVRRFKKVYPEEQIDEFTSDSLEDTPMSRLASKAYLIKKSIKKDWPIG